MKFYLLYDPPLVWVFKIRIRNRNQKLLVSQDKNKLNSNSENCSANSGKMPYN